MATRTQPGDTAPAPPSAEPRWLTPGEQQSWVAASGMLLLLPAALDGQLQRDSGLSLFDYFVLSRLSMAPGRTLRMSELAGLANGSLSRLSNVVKRLEQRGWVHRDPDPDDGRYTVATLTDSGWTTVAAAAPGHVEAVRAYLIDLLSADEVETLASIGNRVADRVRSAGACSAVAPPCPPGGDC
jgi:DNA-binding MarR family transcriptional regulator